nr:NAD(P)/FAD-dependent oxidoreductase [Pseudonocardia sp. AL041005-10]
MSEPVHSLVTVGAGQAAVATVRMLRRRGFDGPLTVLSDEPHLPYQRPPLSKEFLRGDAGSADLVLLDETWAAAHDVELRTGAAVTAVAPGRVELGDGSHVSADAVLLATGVRARTLPGVSGDRVVHLRTVGDAVRLRDALPGLRRLVVVGAGLIGAEVASSARELGVEVVVLEAGPMPMLGALGPDMAAFCAGLYRDHGVDLRCGQEISAVSPTAAGVVVDTSSGPVEADLVVVAVGSVPRDELARAAGIAVDPVRGEWSSTSSAGPRPPACSRPGTSPAGPSVTGSSASSTWTTRRPRAGPSPGPCSGRRCRRRRRRGSGRTSSTSTCRSSDTPRPGRRSWSAAASPTATSPPST